MHPTIRHILGIVLIGVAVVCTGCLHDAKERTVLYFSPQAGISNWSRDARFERLGIRRVAVLPFVNRSTCTEASTRLTEAFSLELRKTRLFDVRVCRHDEPIAQLATSRGTFDAVETRLLGETLNVDAVILGEINEYEPYRPLAIGLRVVMIDTRSGRVVWTVDEMLDTAELAVANLARQYYYDVIDPGASELRVERVLLSMRSFARCVCYHFVRTLTRPMPVESAPPPSTDSRGTASIEL